MREKAAELVSEFRGVLKVVNRLAVVPTGHHSDEVISRQVIRALQRKEGVDPADLTVNVATGVVTLSGAVPTAEARKAAYDAALSVDDAERVENKLGVVE
jgi:osmotically-inducible protein OsmY